MAMIRCPECGKEFSDRAAACPNCGCPTADAIKGNASPQMQQEAEKKLLSAVDSAMQEARSAGAAFETASDDVQKMVRENPVDLNSISARSTIRRIVHAAADACESLYRSYQALIPKLDQECKPLLLMNPGPVAVRAVGGMIQWLNEESKIENNYAVTFNQVNYGDVVQAVFVPSPKNQVIQAEWEAEYDRVGNSDEAERFWRDKLEEHKNLAVKEERDARRQMREIERMMRQEEREEARRKEEEQKRLRKEYAETFGSVSSEREHLKESLRQAKSKLTSLKQQTRPAGSISIPFGVVFVITGFIIFANASSDEEIFGVLFLLAGVALAIGGIFSAINHKKVVDELTRTIAETESKLAEMEHIPTEQEYIRKNSRL